MMKNVMAGLRALAVGKSYSHPNKNTILAQDGQASPRLYQTELERLPTTNFGTRAQNTIALDVAVTKGMFLMMVLHQPISAGAIMA
jgi:hypothetical protein